MAWTEKSSFFLIVSLVTPIPCVLSADNYQLRNEVCFYQSVTNQEVNTTWLFAQEIKYKEFPNTGKGVTVRCKNTVFYPGAKGEYPRKDKVGREARLQSFLESYRCSSLEGTEVCWLPRKGWPTVTAQQQATTSAVRSPGAPARHSRLQRESRCQCRWETRSLCPCQGGCREVIARPGLQVSGGPCALGPPREGGTIRPTPLIHHAAALQESLQLRKLTSYWWGRLA